ncbi:hypothetical protein DWX90_00855 [Segatella copri]|uniref:DUF7833 domain-containing protein n=1 Tax=Segatella copri TaxID=165179 RepID=A0AA92TNV2_9BACT|nr:hypothetical protein DWX90_00855 [Segatella copri]
MNTDNSWIKLPRMFMNWQWYQNTNMVHLYLYLLLNANIENKLYFGISIQRGECLVSLSTLSRDTGISRDSLKRYLKKLKDTKEISYKKLSKGRIIVLLDFDKFQPVGIDEPAPNWIKLYRKICDWQWYQDAKMVHLFVHLMLKASIMKGSDLSDSWQLCTSLRILSKETGLSLQNIRTCIGKLQRTGEITFRTLPTHLQSIITICNSGSYQTSKRQTAPMSPQCRPNCAPMPPLPKEYKNIRNKESKKINTNDARTHEEDFVDFSEKETSKENQQKKGEKESFLSLSLHDDVWLGAIKKKFAFKSIEEVKDKVENFDLDHICRGNKEHKDIVDYKSHFCDWLKFNLMEQSPSKRKSTPNTERWEGEKFVPKSSEGGIYDGPF